MTELNTAKKNHIGQVDYIRAIASMAVALFHLGGKALPGLKYGWMGVQMFFVLSGFIICYAIPNNYDYRLCRKFIAKRIVRIEPPYLVSIALILAGNLVFVRGYRPDWPNVAYHFAYINSFLGKDYLSPVYWTLGLEFQFYLLAAFLFPVFSKKFGFIVVVLLCLPAVFHYGSNLITVFPVFALGIIFFQYYTGIIKRNIFLLSALTIIVFGYLSLGMVQTISAMLALLILYLPLRTNRIISFFARISFSLYLTHDIAGSNLVVFLGTKLPKSFFFRGMEFISGILASILFAYLFYQLVEAPFLRLSKRIRY